MESNEPIHVAPQVWHEVTGGETMKFLLVSDLHYALKHFDWLLSVANRFESVVMAGDHIDGKSHVYMRVQIPVILKYMQHLKEKTQLLVSSGNHDLDTRADHGERVAHWMESVRSHGILTNGDHLWVGDTLFTICPWWDGPRTKETVAKQLATDAEKTKKQWIWIYHGPPDQSPTSWTGKRHYGDADLVEWIHLFAPDIVLTGHIHEAPFVDNGSWVDQINTTWVFNSGRQKGTFPPHIVFDLEENSAVWCSTQGFQRVDLSRPFTCTPETLSETSF